MDTPSSPTGTAVPIYTIGYGSRSMEAFLAVLRGHQIAYVIDIRSMPYSRFKPEFSKDALEAHLHGEGIRYLYMGDALGGQPTDRDCYVDDKVVYDRVRGKAFFREGIDRVRRAFQQQVRVALMCSEGKPSECHRTKLIGLTLAEQGIPVAHIDEHDALRSQADVVGELTEGQLTLFGEPEFRSRKRYRPKGERGDTAEMDDNEA